MRPISSLSRGIEVYHRRNLGDRLSLSASYALANVEETVTSIDNVNVPIPLTTSPTHGGIADQRHAVNVDATYRPWQS